MESVSVNDGTFDEQYRNFQRHGYAVDVHSNQILGDINEYNESFKGQPPNKKKKTQKITSITSFDSSSPWEPIEVEKIEYVVKRDEIDDNSLQNKKLVENKDDGKVSSVINNTPIDYSWLKSPAELRPSDGTHDCFVPKKCLKKYTGHTKGIQEIELFPKTGHLILSASLDGTCKIWDIFGDKTVHQTYLGHNEAVRSINFDSTGLSFISSSFDKTIKLWDVTTGNHSLTHSLTHTLTNSITHTITH
jgi:WD40 repeat protein